MLYPTSMACLLPRCTPLTYGNCQDFPNIPSTRRNLCNIAMSVHPQHQKKTLQPHQIDMFFILEGIEKLWDPGTAVQSQDPSLLFMKNHLEKNRENYEQIVTVSSVGYQPHLSKILRTTQLHWGLNVILNFCIFTFLRFMSVI